MNRLPTLAKHVENYTKLRAWWVKAQAVIAKAATTSAGVELYQLVPREISDESRLDVCGALAYVRFRHDFESGTLEYGALPVGVAGKPVRYVRIRDIAFDGMGNVGQVYHFDDEDDQSFRLLHLQTMAEIVPAIVEMYFSETLTETNQT